jgi:hypothetical protein
MDGFLAYKFYLAVKLHFTSDSYDVFKSGGRVKATYESYMKRNDKGLFEAIAYKFPQEKEYIQYVASNFMYGHPNVIYDSYDDGMMRYMEYVKRKQSITRVFADGLTKLKSYDCGEIFEAYLKNVITLESMVILDSIENVCDSVQNVLVEDQIRLIRKSRRFVKFDKSRIVATYLDFLKEL